MITKSGGNTFSGSFRTTFNNDGWRSLTPYPTDQTVDDITPVYEGRSADPSCATGSGSLAPAVTKPEENRTLAITGGSYVFSQDEPRYEGKLTYAECGEQRQGQLHDETTATKNNRQGTVDLASLYDSNADQHLHGQLHQRRHQPLFLEGQFSQKVSTTTNVGSRFTDLVKGTYISDRQRLVGTASPRFNSPTFCAVCGGGWLEHRDNRDWFVKASLSCRRRSAGSHNLVAGFDDFKEWRKNDNWQSGSQYASPRRPRLSRVRRSTRSCGTTTRRSSTGCRSWSAASATTSGPIPVRQRYLALQQRSDVQLRRANRSKPLEGSERVLRSCATRNGARAWAWRGTWAATAAGSRAPASRATSPGSARRSSTPVRPAGGRPASAGSTRGRTSTPAPLRTSPRSRHCRFSGTGSFRTVVTPVQPHHANIPGLSTKVRGEVKSPSNDEVSVGIADHVGQASGGSTTSIGAPPICMATSSISTGRVLDPTGRPFDLTLVSNATKAKRVYDAMIVDARYRLPRLQLGGNYTVSRSWGNANGENVGSGPIRTSMDTFPEYREERWNYPMGYNPGDQRHQDAHLARLRGANSLGPRLHACRSYPARRLWPRCRCRRARRHARA